MKLPIADCRLPKPAARTGRAGFTMIEVALCLAIMGFALVSILLVLPSGMNTQRDTRQETIINQDATVLLEAPVGLRRLFSSFVAAHSNLCGRTERRSLTCLSSWALRVSRSPRRR